MKQLISMGMGGMVEYKKNHLEILEIRNTLIDYTK